MTANGMKTILFAATRAFALKNSRMILMKHFLSAGWRVVAAVPEDCHSMDLAREGMTIEAVPFRRGGLAPVNDGKCLLRLIRIYRKYRPELVHHFHGKPIILGGIAARFVPATKVVNTITGLGYAFLNGGPMRELFVIGYRLLAAHSNLSIFQNPDDRDYFLRRGWVTPERTELIVSSGVDVERFRPPLARIRSEEWRILMIARLVWMKGVREFVEAARIVKKDFPQARFQMAGDWDPVHPDAVPQPWIKAAIDERVIDYLGYLPKMEEELPKVDLCVLPSYREGTPRVILEAAACGIPAVTTDVPGCRETVVDGETGFLVPPRDSAALARAILKLLEDPRLRAEMGERARRRVEQEFDIRDITQRQLRIYRSLGIEIDLDAVCV